MRTRSIAAGELAVAAAVWRALEHRTGSTALACSWVWTAAWLAHYGDAVRHRFVVAEHGGVDVGIALVTLGATRFPAVVGARQAHVGTAGEPRGEGVYVERNRLLVEPAHQDAFAAALLGELREDRRWDRLVIPGLVPDCAESFARASDDVVLDPRGSPVADLAHAAGDDPLELLTAGPRRRVRRALNGLAPLSTEWAQTPAEGHAIMDELVELHQRRWAAVGRPGAFADARFAAFHRTLIDDLEPGRGVVLVRVRSGEETVGCVYGLVDGRDVLFYQSGLRRYPDNKLNAGLVVHMCAMRACAERGFAAYDFLAPDMRYKLDLSTRKGSLVWATLERRRPRTYVDRGLRRAQAARERRRARPA